jgi:creatinine amidohydrolase/Fe(II)-dependent formamide hydrolase-like protein
MILRLPVMLAAAMTTFQVQKEMLKNHKKGLKNIALFPVGSIEQHGPRLPLNTDTAIAEACAKELDRREANRLFVYPAIQYTNADSGIGFVGGLTVSHGTVRRLLSDIGFCVRRQGFDGLVFVDGHAINKPDLMEVAHDIVSQSFRDGSPFPVLVMAGYDGYETLARRHGVRIGRHADWFEALLFAMSQGTVPVETGDIADPFPDKWPDLVGIPGIPLGFRSQCGVLGQTSNPDLTEDLRQTLWSDYVDLIHERFTLLLQSFFARSRDHSATPLRGVSCPTSSTGGPTDP